MATPQNILIKRGDSRDIRLTFTDGDGAVIDITGWTVYFTVKDDIEADDDNALIKKDVTAHTNPTQGETKIELTYDDTNITSKNYYYDLQVKTDEDKVYTVLEGVFVVEEDVTRRTT